MVVLLVIASAGLTAAEPVRSAATAPAAKEPSTEVRLTAVQWAHLNQSVDRGLLFLSTQQQRDGSFAAPDVRSRR
jgi:hypothetical protein